MVLGALCAGCLCSQAVRAQTTSWSIGYTGSITTWTVPYTGQYDITAYGAQGGGGAGNYDPTTGSEWAAGAIIGGRFQLTSGQVLSLLVGGSGGWSFPSYINQPGHFSMSGGGGGGTFVVNSSTTPLVVAGGGGGIGTLLTVRGGPGGNNDLANASTSTSGYDAPGVYIDLEGGYGGTNGGGGGIGNNSKDIGGGGGGGFYGDGGTHYKTGAINHGEVQSYGGSSYVNGGAGGSGGLQDYGNFGGFGGGGQGGFERAGGGGGYSGGGGGGGVLTSHGSGTSPLNTGNGGGGGSFLAAEATNSTMSVGNTGNGLVTINRIIVDLLVGEDASNQVVSITGGTSTYPDVFVGVNAVDDANTLSVTGAGTLLTSASNVVVGVSGSGNSMVVSAGGTVVTSSGTYTGVAEGGVIGYNAGASNNAVTVTGNGSAWNNAYNVIVGYGGSGNSLTISAGGAVTAGNTAYSATLGYDAGSANNSVTVTGSGSTFSNNSVLVGVSGTGNSMVVSAGGRVLTGGGGSYIGTGSTSSGNSVLVTGTGSEWTNDSFLFVGNLGSGNSLTVSDGGSVTANVVDVGYSPGNAGNSVVVSGGGSISSASTYIGRYGSSNSVLVTGSGSTWTNTSSAPLYIGFGGTDCSLTVADGGSVSAAHTTIGFSGVLNIGRFGSSDAAGTLSSSTIAFGVGSGRINFNQSDTTTISSAISGTGSLYQLGSGTTILTGHNTYTGTTVVQNGTLLVEGQGGLGDVAVSAGGIIGGSGSLGGSLFLDSGARLLFRQGQPLTVNGASVAFGGFDIADLVGLDGTVPLGAYTIINGAAAIDFSNLAQVGESNAYDIGGGKRAFFSSGSLIVNVVPEPGTCIMALAGLACGGFSLRRRSAPCDAAAAISRR